VVKIVAEGISIEAVAVPISIEIVQGIAVEIVPVVLIEI
jgi:hypothetical protein